MLQYRNQTIIIHRNSGMEILNCFLFHSTRAITKRVIATNADKVTHAIGFSTILVVGLHEKRYWYISIVLFLPLIMLLEPFYCPYRNTFSMTNRALIEVFFHSLTDFLWFELDRIHRFPAVTTKKSDISAFWIEGIFSFFPKRRDIDEVSVGGGRHEI